MRTLTRAVVFAAAVAAAFVAGTFVPAASTQAPSSRYVMIEHMKSQPGQDYIKYEREWWQPIHRERLKQGKIRSWAVYSRMYPSGSSMEDFVVVTTVDKFNDLDLMNLGYGEIFAKAHAGKKPSDMPSAQNVRDLTRREMWVLVDEVK